MDNLWSERLTYSRKSRLAIEYAHEIQQQSPSTWVLWVHASNATRYEQSFRDIADHVKIHGRDDPQGNIFRLVRNWLRGERNRRWRLVLDSLDDPSFLLDTVSLQQNNRAGNTGQSTPPRLIDYLPNCENGSILITSRDKGAALQLVEHSHDIFLVEPMSQTEAKDLIEKKLRSQIDEACVAQLARDLECMPLAIVHATAYITRRPEWSVTKYLEEFKQSDQRKTGLLHADERGLLPGRDAGATNSIMTTWKMSFDHIRQIRPSAADLLALMSFFDRQKMPKSLLRDRRKAGHGENIGRSSTFDDDALLLQEYSFVYASETAESFQMHRLVQLATQKWLQDSNSYGHWKHEFISRLRFHLPDNAMYVNWETWRKLLPHARMASTLRPDTNESLLDWATLLYHMGYYFIAVGNGHEAQRVSTIAMEIRKGKLPGADDDASIDSIALVGRVYHLNGDWVAAHKLAVEVFSARQNMYGPVHLKVLLARNNLGVSYRTLGQWAAAEKQYSDAIRIHGTILGPKHPMIVATYNNLAVVYEKQERWEDAEALYLEILQPRERELDGNYPGMLQSINNLAVVYEKQGRLEAAEEQHDKILQILKEALGLKHPETLQSMNNLAVVYLAQRRWDAAEKLHNETLQIRQDTRGLDHPDTLESMWNLALALKGLGRFGEAMSMMEQCVKLGKERLGAEHPTFVQFLNTFIEWSGRRGKYTVLVISFNKAMAD